MKPELLTIDGAAELVDVDRNTIRYWRSTGKLEVAGYQTVDGKRRVVFTRGAVMQVVSGICDWCGSPFRRGTAKARFCSPACRKKAHRGARR